MTPLDPRRASFVNSTDPRRRILLELFQAGLDRVSGRRSVARALTGSAGPVWIAAIGKAASAMALGAYDVLGVSIERTLIITKMTTLPRSSTRYPMSRSVRVRIPFPTSVRSRRARVS